MNGKARNGARQRAVTDSSTLAARFRSITEMPAGALPHLFIEGFARAFVAAYRQNNAEHTEELTLSSAQQSVHRSLDRSVRPP